MKFFSIFLVLNVIFLSKWVTDAQVCSSSDYPSKPGPSPTPSIPGRYSARVEVNQLEDDKTYEMRAFYDYSKKKAALEIRDNGVSKKLIFNYETDEIFSLASRPTSIHPVVPPPDYQPVYPTTCETFQLSTSLSLNYYFGFSGISTNLFPASAGTFFRLNTNSYAGEELVRGILCDVYASCQNNVATNSNYTIKLYFTKINAVFPGNNATYPRVILRAKYSGVALQTNGTLKPFTNTFDYFDFRLDFDRDDIFQTPGGVFCEKRKLTSIKPPKASGNLKFSEEIVSKGVISHITDLAYDTDLQLVRYETRDRFGNDSDITYDKFPQVYVNDYTLGVSYITNKHTGKCTIDTIDVFAFASDANFTQDMLDSGNGYAIRMKSASSLLELDLDYIFTGQREIDGIMSDIFVAKSQLSKGISVINEYAFTPNDFVSLNLNQREKNIPKRLGKASPQSTFSSISTFYNFDTSEIDTNYFDVSQCYQGNSLVQFRLIFKPKSDIDMQILKRVNLNQALRKSIYLALGQLSGEKSLRFSIPRLTLAENGNLFVRSAILPGPEPLKLFSFFPKKLLTSTGFTYATNISTPLVCALRCLKSTKCLSFDHSNSSKACYLNEKHYSNGTFSGFSTTYDHYSRNSLTYVKFEEKYIVWSDLQLKVNSKSQSFRFEVTDSNNQTFPVVLDAQLIEEVKNNENRFGSTALLSRYNLKKPNFKFSQNIGQLYGKLSVDECAKKCTDEIGVPCKSFHFCFLTQECLLTQEAVTNDQTGYESNNYCDIYEKDSLIHYSIFRTKASINPKDKKFQGIENPSECADKCDNELKINCKSFNFCPNSKECYLSERHLADGSTSGTGDLVCDHYSRKYIEDFTYINSDEIPLNGEVVLKNVNDIEFCSFACVNSDGFSCKSFDYCPESKSCLLNSGQKPIGSNIQNVERDICSHYRREYFVATSSRIKTKDSSSGTLVALSIVFAFVSVALGGVGSVFYLKKFGNKN